MIVSTSHHFIFIHVYKTAGEAVVAALPQISGRSGVTIWEGRKPRPYPSHPVGFGLLAKHSTAAMIRSALPAQMWSQYFKFAFVREPVDRVVSLFNYAATVATARRRISLDNLLHHSPLRRYDPLDAPSIRAFRATDSFSSYIRHQDTLRDDAMRPQWLAIADPSGDCIVDFVGRYENLDRDMEHIQNKLGLPVRIPPRKNVSSVRKMSRAHVSREDEEYLRELFALDYQHFGY